MVAGVHFLPGRVDWRDVGWKAMASNISDIAAMGGRPAFALVTLCLPPDAHVADIDALYEGLRACASEYGASIVGGDVVRAGEFSITVSLTGTATTDASGAPLLLRRNAARIGDAIAVTGPLGGSAGGLRALASEQASDQVSALMRRHMRPQPRVDAGIAAVEAGVRCGMDISDGLLQDLAHICAASRAGATIDAPRVPLDDALLAAYPDDALALALTGGEDYELLLVAPEATLAGTARRLPGTLAVIGHIVDDAQRRVRALDGAGREMTIGGASGFDHLRDVKA
jgi:thiamine-monophosphate kinase